MEMLGDCPFWADYAWLDTLPTRGRHTLVAASDDSPLHKAKLRKCDEVISIEEELEFLGADLRALGERVQLYKVRSTCKRLT